MKKAPLFALAIATFSAAPFVAAQMQAVSTNSVVMQQTVTQAEKEAIFWMLEEEKLAHDVYQALYKKWGHRVFNNIANAEQQHMAAMHYLASKYNVTNTAYSEAGKFHNAELQKLYDQLVALGQQSLTEAFKVGAEIEELDIPDLNKLINTTQNSEIKSAFALLNKGSRNHLRSFTRVLNQYNVEYKPIHLNQTEYDTIVRSKMERGGGGFQAN